MMKKLRTNLAGNDMFWGFVGLGMIVVYLIAALVVLYFAHLDHSG